MDARLEAGLCILLVFAREWIVDARGPAFFLEGGEDLLLVLGGHSPWVEERMRPRRGQTVKNCLQITPFIAV
jgi:hypothetical protein